jgi:uncharacterized protein (UPF0261 family)
VRPVVDGQHPGRITLIELDCAINDDEFADAVIRLFQEITA